MIRHYVHAFNPVSWILVSGVWGVLSLSTLTVILLFTIVVCVKKNKKLCSWCIYGLCLQPLAFLWSVGWALINTDFPVGTSIVIILKQWQSVRIFLTIHAIIQISVIAVCLMSVIFRYGNDLKIPNWYVLLFLLYGFIFNSMFVIQDLIIQAIE